MKTKMKMKNQIVEMRVMLDCPGCERNITKALSKLEGVDTVDIDVAMQKVRVTGWADEKKVLKAVRKSSGRKAELWPFPYNPEHHDYYAHYYGNGSSNYLYSDHYTSGSGSGAYFVQPRQVSAYNYEMHGYNGHQHGYYPQPLYSAVLDTDATSIFSDDNATGCTIM